MITDIEINNIGLFKKAKYSDLKKINIVYAENGKGKTTFTDIFQSHKDSKTSIISTRKTIDSNENPLIKIQHDTTPATIFANNSWRNRISSDIHIFNTRFIEKNIYNGQEISAENRKNLLTFALGENSVNASIKIDKINKLEGIIKKNKTAQEKNLNKICLTHSIKIDDVRSEMPSNIEECDNEISKRLIQKSSQPHKTPTPEPPQTPAHTRSAAAGNLYAKPATS
ncbi:AAA family ATPase [Rothia terrae]|uniref:AAA family ATPase n=1 Tax=Rothia terrae TaxID=396015 RepID=UPI00144755F9|nr:AAA family ATPase [Rothia terrae]NKZ33393.1 AAA family ATPase [Rothia terrae]